MTRIPPRLKFDVHEPADGSLIQLIASVGRRRKRFRMKTVLALRVGGQGVNAPINLAIIDLASIRLERRHRDISAGSPHAAAVVVVDLFVARV